jgi:integrase
MEREVMKGHIRKRGNKYAIVVDIGYDEKGKRKQKWFSGYNSKKEAEKDLARILHEINEGTFVEPSKEKFKTFLENWLEIKKNNIRPSTYTNYSNYIYNHIIPNLGNLELAKIKPMHLEKFYAKCAEKLSPTTISKMHKLISSIFNYAVRHGYISKNPCHLVDAPKKGASKIRTWNEEQVQKFLECAKKSRYYIAFLLAITTGMRRGEILGLRWSDIDFEKKTISINQVLSNDGKMFQEPKTEYSKRLIALPDITVRELKRHRKRILHEKFRAGGCYIDLDLVVCTSLGNRVHPMSLQRMWWDYIEASGVPRIRFHDLRHTHATLMLKQGVHPKIVSERLGHSSVTITLDTYSHVLPGLQELAAQHFEEMVFGQKEKQNKTL